MPQTLRTNYYPRQHHNRHALIPIQSYAAFQTLEGLLTGLQHLIAKAKADLLQPRQQAIDLILREAASLH
jgi:hypothetical protein